MSIWIKICGNTSLTDTQAAMHAGADALGFVFAPSTRKVDADQVAQITRELPDSVEKIGVFVDTDFEQIAQSVKLAGLTGVQLHSSSLPGLSRQLRAQFGGHLRILQVVHFGKSAALHLAAVKENASLDGVLIDSRTAEAVGGTGVAFDWQAASEGLFRNAGQIKLIAAGGLTPANVADAIATMKPWGVDVVSGVEHVKGQKDHEKVRAFVRNARAAGGTLL